MSTKKNRSRTFVLATLAALGGVVAAIGDAEAAPVRVPAAFQPNLGHRVRGSDGNTYTVQELFAKLDAAKTIRLKNGRVISAQQYVDMLEELHNAATRHGLRQVPREAFVSPAAQRAVADQAARHDAELARTPAPPQAMHGGSLLNLGALRGPLPQPVWKPFELGANYGWSYGNKQYLMGYTDFKVSSDAKTSDEAGCRLDWDAGAWLMGTQHPLVRFTAGYGMKRTGMISLLTADAALYVMGQATPVWEHKNSGLGGTLTYSKATPPLDLDYTFVPGVIGVHGTAGAAFTMQFSPTAMGQSMAHEAVCSIGATPSAKVSGFAQGSVTIGAADLASIQDIITAGLRADVVAADVKVPVTNSIQVYDSPAKVDGDFKVDIDASFMKGDLYAFYDIQDVCIGLQTDDTHCIGSWTDGIADDLGIPMSWKHYFWKSDGYALHKNLANYHF